MLKAIAILTSLMLGAALQQPATAPPPQIPPEAAKMVNPFKPTPEAQERARKFYGWDCEMCHGANGNGRGELAKEMKLQMIDFTDPAATRNMTDGEMFWVIRNGKDKMPAEGERAKDEDVWNMVVIMRSFAKK